MPGPEHICYRQGPSFHCGGHHTNPRTLLLLPGTSFQSKKTFANPSACCFTLRAFMLLQGTIIPLCGPSLQFQISLSGPKDLLPKIQNCIFITTFFCVIMDFSGAHAGQSAFLAPIISKGASSLSHCSQWAILSFVLVHSINTANSPKRTRMNAVCRQQIVRGKLQRGVRDR